MVSLHHLGAVDIGERFCAQAARHASVAARHDVVGALDDALLVLVPLNILGCRRARRTREAHGCRLHRRGALRNAVAMGKANRRLQCLRLPCVPLLRGVLVFLVIVFGPTIRAGPHHAAVAVERPHQHAIHVQLLPHALRRITLFRSVCVSIVRRFNLGARFRGVARRRRSKTSLTKLSETPLYDGQLCVWTSAPHPNPRINLWRSLP